MKVINLTPHDINILTKESCYGLEQDSTTKQWIADGVSPIRVIKSSGVARVQVSTIPGTDLDGIPTQKPSYGDIDGLPAPELGVAYVVSLMCVSAAISHGRSTIDLYTWGVLVRSRKNPSIIYGCFDLNHQG